MSLKVTFDNATDDELAEGLAAAQVVLQASAVDAMTAAAAAFDLDYYEVSGYYARSEARQQAGLVDPPEDQGPSDDLIRIADVWQRASEAARQAVRAASRKEPLGPGLELE